MCATATDCTNIRGNRIDRHESAYQELPGYLIMSSSVCQLSAVMPPWVSAMWTLLTVIILAAQHTVQGATVSVTKCCPEGQVVRGDGQDCVAKGTRPPGY